METVTHFQKSLNILQYVGQTTMTIFKIWSVLSVQKNNRIVSKGNNTCNKFNQPPNTVCLITLVIENMLKE